MKKISTIFLLCMSSLVWAGTAHAILISLQPSSQKIPSPGVVGGGLGTINLVASGLTGSPFIGEFSALITFGTAITGNRIGQQVVVPQTPLRVKFGLGLGSVNQFIGFFHIVPVGPNPLIGVLLNQFTFLPPFPLAGSPTSLSNLQSGLSSLVLATIPIKANFTGASTTILSLSNVAVKNGLGNTIAVTVGPSVKVNVPEPPVIVLIMLGVVGIWLRGFCAIRANRLPSY